MIIGVDEVGRGSWAGPLVAAAVGFTDSREPKGLADSKVLTFNQRSTADKAIRKATSIIGIGWVWPEEINDKGLTKSVELAMTRAIQDCAYSNNEIVVDGHINYLSAYPKSRAVIKADATVPAVSAASIIAKVARDMYMIGLAKNYPQYGFETHVGYGTKKHLQALVENGILPIHRINYKPIQKLLQGI